MQKVNYYCTNYNALYADIMAFLFQILQKRSIVLHKGQPMGQKGQKGQNYR